MKDTARPTNSVYLPIKTTSVASPILQRKCAWGETPGPSGECEECRQERQGTLQCAVVGGSKTGSSVSPIVQDVLRSSGQPLDASTRAYIEQRFGYDFSGVRMHSDEAVGQSARDVNANAYTMGHDIMFGVGQFAPGTHEGRRLLAHELAHVVQQSSRCISPMIQRSLIVHGNKKDIKAFLGLLEPASGLSLKYDPDTKKVSVTGSRGKPPQSPELASQLQTIIQDPQQDAELNLGRKKEGVRFGAFPTSLRKKT